MNPEQHPSHTCQTCGNVYQDTYCNKCGEKAFDPRERSILAFLESLLNAFTFLEAKSVRSIMLILRHPGQLSKNLSQGIRVPYMRLISLFFVANFFYFLFPVFDAFNSSLTTQMNLLGPHSIRATEIVNSYLKEHNLTLQAFTQIYQASSTNLSKLFIIILVVMLSCLLAIVNYSRKAFFADHLLFALEFYTFNLLVNLVILANLFFWIVRGAWLLWGINLNILLTDNVFSTVGACSLFYFLIRAQLTFYPQKWYFAVARSIALYYLMGETVYFYRSGLFYLTMWTL